MTETITTPAQLDALPVGTVLARLHSDGSGPTAYVLDRDAGWEMASERITAPRVGPFDSVGNDLGPLVVLYRPDAEPAPVTITAEQREAAIASLDPFMAVADTVPVVDVLLATLGIEVSR